MVRAFLYDVIRSARHVTNFVRRVAFLREYVLGDGATPGREPCPANDVGALGHAGQYAMQMM